MYDDCCQHNTLLGDVFPWSPAFPVVLWARLPQNGSSWPPH
jgi:hypothetical protein